MAKATKKTTTKITKKKEKNKEDNTKTCPNCINVRYITAGKLKCYKHDKLRVTPQDFCDNFRKYNL